MAKIAIVGSGGREHALGHNFLSDEHTVYYFGKPNAGMDKDGAEHIAIDCTKPENFDKLIHIVDVKSIDMLVVGPEQPLTLGLVDHLNSRDYHNVIGPTKKAALLEADKFFSWYLLDLLGLPQAESVPCFNISQAKKEIDRRFKDGIVIKYSFLAGGKGVSVCDSKEEAYRELKRINDEFGTDVLIAERLRGHEVSVFYLTDGENVVPFSISIQDHKPIFDNDRGPNTGGMGSYGPAPFASSETINEIGREIVKPIVRAVDGVLGEPYKGVVYAGMIMTKQGPKVLEFNIRFGDPENQVLMMMLQGGLYNPFVKLLEGKLDPDDLKMKQGVAACVVMASEGYPGKYTTGHIITGLDEAERIQGVKVFHAGTERRNGGIVTAGGRVLGVTAYRREGLEAAIEAAYQAVALIQFQSAYYRRDIGRKGLVKC